MTSGLHKLSPSDFRYLWEDCKHCYWKKVKKGVYLPSIGLPGVFNTMNSLLQDTIQGMSLKDVNSDLPSGTVHAKESYVKSAPIPPTKDCFISGRVDILSELEDGTYGLIDFKISNQDEEKVQKFTHQLHAYKFALENPLKGDSRQISKMGLIVISPDSISFNDGHVMFKTKPSWYEIEEDMDSFYSFISEVSGLLNRPLPKPTDTCDWCEYRKHFPASVDDEKEDIPF